ncbi:hypothetical protein FM106_30225 [Brachybacterium faecium]|uniref:LysM domain-containing protein n=1 Tax=Brachybacterium faecium (strain ATCC 43885 / DSM 4810 / JCM 11609 / LMG 19847 / NBRC 14762 / NCIMB 9860 / 6-10) TaxID=446465 RepID=C7ME58_BRAFD|nr:LysM peptidoglycan-binding domain-containing protein [Brachybacterium faecium]ACU85865.1 LysM domain-containing protein [Brachybacterium faecium DSM 4810]SLN05253.1 hypothetical protein FM106_30225 [Brachybacterium faecium]
MREHTAPPIQTSPGTSLFSAAIAAAGTLAMGAPLASLHGTARSAPSSEALIAWVLLSLAALGMLLCLYLTVIWALAATIMLVGPASRTGAALLGALRLLAPRLARRLATGAAVATAATALTLTSSMAAQGSSSPETTVERAPIAQTSQLVSADLPPADPAPEAAPAGGTGTASGARDPASPLPPLGWGEAAAPHVPAPAPATADPPDATEAGAETADEPESEPEQTVVVHPGDSLWSISEDLLGPAQPDPEEVAAAWPLLHDANRDVIGTDPDLLRPGQELTVPTALTHQDTP